MPRPRGKIARLPDAVRQQLNRKLRDGWTYHRIVDWLFALKTREDNPNLHLKAREPYSLVWTRAGKNEHRARISCKAALCVWFNTHYQIWLKEQAEQNVSVRLVKELDQLGRAADEQAHTSSVTGANLLIRSQIYEAIQLARKRDKNAADIALLANSWARMNQVGTEVEKLKLRTQEAIEAGLHALHEEMKANPEALEQFNKLRETVKRPAKPSA